MLPIRIFFLFNLIIKKINSKARFCILGIGIRVEENIQNLINVMFP